jgi:hypothetical protein
MSKRVIVLEFNELCPSLMEQFMKQGLLPGFSRLHSESYAYVTDAEEVAPNLEPWIQWVTVHTGLSFPEHGIHDLGDGHKLSFPRIWDLVSDSGRKVWVCGSMNAATRGKVNGYVLPDPWSTGIEPQPAGEFDAYWRFVRTYVQEYTRKRVPLTRSDYLKFLRFLMSRGLSARSVSHTVSQVLSERKGKGRWRRATILDRLQWDIFRWYYRKTQPDYATFFLNSTAHFQHFYWRAMDPGPFEVKPSAEDVAEYGNAILYGYQQMDRIVQECLQLAGKETTIIFATALSQQPCLIYETKGGKKQHRAVDYQRMLKLASVTAPARLSPVMSEQFHIYFDKEADAGDAERNLKAWRVDGRPAMSVRREAAELFAGCSIYTELPAEARLTSEINDLNVRFYDLFYLVDGTKSGMHHPDGILWIRTPEKHYEEAGQERIPLRAVAPTIMSLLGIAKPEFMSSESLPLGSQMVKPEVPVGATVPG